VTDREILEAAAAQERIHGIDERVPLASMLETAQVLAPFIRDWSGSTARRREAAGNREEKRVVHHPSA
jgi:hypothetical protein